MKEPTTPKDDPGGYVSLHRPNGRRRLVWAAVCAVGLVIMIVLMLVVPVLTRGAAGDAVIRIPAGATSQTVADSLRRHLGEGYADLVMRVAALRRTDFSRRHGAYLIEAGMSPLRAERRLSQGGQHPVRVTLNNSRSLQSIADKVSSRLDLTSEEFTAYVESGAPLVEHGLTGEQAMALFVDDSYEFYWTATPAEVVKKISANYDRVWDDGRRAKARELGLTPAQVMTLCSIVDEETNKTDEKGAIGRLYINRLRKGMPLQADPTVKFALGDFSLRRIRGSHLGVESPYNTYRVKGLPPGPIRTTSVQTIDAVLNSQPSEFIYMCAKDDFSGRHSFAADYATHMENARRYQRALNARNIN